MRNTPKLMLVIFLSVLASFFSFSSANAEVSVTLTYHFPDKTEKQYPVTLQDAPYTVQRAMEVANAKFTTTYFNSSLGYALMQAESAKGLYPSSTTGNFEKKYWALHINGVYAQQGMTTQQVNNGDKIDWKWDKIK